MEDVFHLGVKALIQNKKSQILLLEKNPKKRSGFNPPHWDLPGGRLKKGDRLDQALLREVKEEIGIKDLQIIKLIDSSISKFRVHLRTYDVGLILFTYLCSSNTPAQILDDEHQTMKWCNKNEAVKLLKLKFADSLIEQIKKL